MHPVVELEGVVGVSEVLFYQFFAFAQAASFFLFCFWHKRLGKPQGRTLRHRQKEDGSDNFYQ